MTQRMYHGLSGDELIEVIVAEVRRTLKQDTRFGVNIVFHQTSFKWWLELQSEPSNLEGGVMRAQVAKTIVSPAAAPVSTPLVGASAPPIRADVDAKGRPVGGPTPESSAQDQRMDRLEAMIQTLANTVAAQPKTVGGHSGMGDMSVQPPESTVPASVFDSVRPDTEVLSRQHRGAAVRATATGLPIEGGARSAPGPEAAGSWGEGGAVGVAQGETIRIDGPAHPGIEEGGIGAPDAMRRAAGIPLLTTERRGGQMVDVREGSF